MTRHRPFHQLQEYLRRWFDGLVLPIKDGLDLWMQATADLPRHMQHAQSEAASQLVHAALQDAAQLMNRSEQEQLAWLFKHLPGISTMMQDCLRDYLAVTIKRLGILESVILNSGGALEGQVGKRLVGELQTYVLLEILGWVFCAVCPTAVVVNALFHAEALAPHLQGVQHSRGHRQQQFRNRLQQQEQLINMLGLDMQEALGICSPLQEQIVQAKCFLGRVGLLAIDTPEESVQRMTSAFKVLGIVCNWLIDLASTLKSFDAASTVLLKYVMHCAMALGVCMKQNFPPWGVRMILCRTLRCRALSAKLIECMSAEYVVGLMRAFGVRAEHMMEHGLSDRQVQQLQAALGIDIDKIESVPDIQHTVLYGMQPDGSEGMQAKDTSAVATGSNFRGGVGVAVDDAREPSGVAMSSGEENLNDMKALLRQMYGTLAVV